MKQIILITLLLPIVAASQITLPPGQSITITAQQPQGVVIHDTIWQCPPVPQPIDTTKPGSYGTLLFQTGYDNTSTINTNQGPLNKISTTIYKTAPGSFRTEAGPGTNVSNGYRSEMQYSGSTYNPAVVTVEYDVYYENWKAFGGGGHSIQWHPQSSSGSAVLSLQNYGGKFNVVRSLGGSNFHQQSTQMTTLPNRWYKMRWEIKWSGGTDGYIRLYIDGALYYSFTGKTTDVGTPYLKVGQNRWNTSTSMGVNTVVYYDNLKIWNSAGVVYNKNGEVGIIIFNNFGNSTPLLIGGTTTDAR